MTKEEAIDIIKCLAWHTRPNEEDVEQAIKALEQEPRWIPVSERLPEKGKQVLCCNKHGSVFTSAITYVERHKDGHNYVCFGQHHDIIAWMPLPEPYNTESEGEE